jgi:hypothetical protein
MNQDTEPEPVPKPEPVSEPVPEVFRPSPLVEKVNNTKKHLADRLGISPDKIEIKISI